MTVNYNRTVLTSHPWTFFSLLLSWRGSIWKAVYAETVLFIVLYAAVAVFYRLVLDEASQRIFEAIVRYFNTKMNMIPIEFVLGFLVTTMVERWTKLYQTIGFIDNVGLIVNCYIRGSCDKARLYRRNIIRYCELVQILVFRDISMRVRRRLPSLEHVVAAGFMTRDEYATFQSYETSPNRCRLGVNYWIPANWALTMSRRARNDGFIESDYFKTQVDLEIKKWRTNIEWLVNYDWVPLCLIYPQVVCLAVNLYFIVALVSRQILIDSELPFGFPFMTLLQFIFYKGWLNVIEAMLNPFGEDDDDFETNALIDRNICMGLKIADNSMQTPELIPDDFDATITFYSEQTVADPSYPYHGSASSVKLKQTCTMVPHSP